MTTESDRERAARVCETVRNNLKRWRLWFPDEESSVDISRADLLALVAIVEEAIKPAGTK